MRRSSSSKQSRLKRLVLTYHDLQEARQALHRLMGLEVSRSSLADKVVRRALMTSLVVSYARPFSGNKGEDGAIIREPKRLTRGLSVEHARLHVLLIKLRNEDFAHADAKRAEVRFYVDRDPHGQKWAVPVSNVTRAGLREETLPAVGSLIELLASRVLDEMRELINELEARESF